MQRHWIITLFVFFACSSALSAELDKRQICAWDPVGLNGPVIQFFSNLIPIAMGWGLDLEFVPYSDERLAAKDFDEGKCDVAIVTAIISRNFVQFAGTLDAIGGITSETKLRRTLATIASPKATDLLTTGDYEVVAALPVGSMFAFVRDRSVNSIDDFRSKRIAVLNGDIQTQTFALLADAKPINESLSTFAHSFNTGNVDIVLMPALAYNTFELYNGLGKHGGIMDEKMFYGMLQAVARKSAFAEDFGLKMRRYMLTRLNEILTIIRDAEESIPKHYWIKTSAETRQRLNEFYKDIRLTLKVENKMSAKALSLLWKVRCSESPEQEECRRP